MAEIKKETKFRLRAKWLFLTYKTHLPKDDYKNWSLNKFRTYGIILVELAHETGTNNDVPYEHTHAVFQLDRSCDFSSPKCLDYKDIHPNIQTLKNEEEFGKICRYIAKEDPECKYLLDKFPDESLAKSIMKCESKGEALNKFMKRPGDAPGIIACYNAGNKLNTNYRKRTLHKYIGPDIVLRRWQQSLKEILDKEPEDRKILWIYETTGNVGKTWFTRYMSLNNPNLYIRTTDMGTSRDAATIIKNALEKGWESWGIFINLPRSAENHTRMYDYLECLLDGGVTTQKYSGDTLDFDEPHVVVFANWPPNTSTMSEDRWEILRIENDALVSITNEEWKTMARNETESDNLLRDSILKLKE